jgi:benzoate-CoA ligase family protein
MEQPMQQDKPVFPEDAHTGKYFLLDRISEGLGAHTAILFGDRKYTYDHVAQQSLRAAQVLADAGVRRGERVLIVLPDMPTFAYAFFGTLLRGAVVAMGNPEAPASQVEYLVRYTRATCVITVPKVATALAAASFPELQRVFVAADAATTDDPEAPSGVEISALTQDFCAALSAVSPMRELPSLHRDEPCIWLFTSGSTGEPKANIHTHRDFMYNTEVYAKGTVGYQAGDVTVSVPRLFFGYATGTNLMFPFAVGATAGLFSERPTPESISLAIERYGATLVTNVPTMLGKLLEHDEALRAAGGKGLDFSRVRFSLSAGEALPEPLLRRWQARFTSDVYDGIGSAEMFHIYASNRPGDIKPGSLGKVVRGYELLILPEDAEGAGATPCATGEIGVLWVRGDSVSQGYFLDRDKSFRTFHGHWCRTGDLFRIDDDGYLYFAGRADELLKVGGQWVAPVEVEECLMRHEAVQLAAVIGIEHDGLTKTKAFVELRAGFAPSAELGVQLQDFVRGAIAKYKYPRLVEFVAELPKNDRGKVDKKALRARES